MTSHTTQVKGKKRSSGFEWFHIILTPYFIRRVKVQSIYTPVIPAYLYTVAERTTTQEPTTPTTTEPPPPEAPCDDLTGRWTATSPTLVDMCLEIDNSRNGRIIGLFRNASDPYFIEIRGRVAPYAFNQVGFTGVWPVNIGTLAFGGEYSDRYPLWF